MRTVMICMAENSSTSLFQEDFVFARSYHIPTLSREMQEVEFLFFVFILLKSFGAFLFVGFCVF